MNSGMVHNQKWRRGNETKQKIHKRTRTSFYACPAVNVYFWHRDEKKDTGKESCQATDKPNPESQPEPPLNWGGGAELGRVPNDILQLIHRRMGFSNQSIIASATTASSDIQLVASTQIVVVVVVVY